MSDQLIMNDPAKNNGRGKQAIGFFMILLVLAIGVGIGTFITDRADAADPGDNQLQMPPTGQSVGGPLQAFSQAFAEVSKNVSPAVVNINVEEVVIGGQGFPPEYFEFFGDEGFFGNPFGNQQVPPGAPKIPPGTPRKPQERVQRGQGSGVIVNPNGYIITNNHVVETATKIRVSLAGNPEEYIARLVGTDPEGDIAVIKIDGDKPFPYAKIGNSQNMKVGDWVVAFGSPLGLEQTMTAGIISATGRTFSSREEGPSLYSDYLQTDAAINMGNSGGPLVNMNGEVVGINSFISTSSGSSAGLGFAVPSHIFVNIYNQILETGRFSRGWLGIHMNTLPFTAALAEHFGVKQGSGALVLQLIDEKGNPSDTAGPAAKAGIRPEDVIINIDGVKIKDNQDLMLAIANTVPGKTANVSVVRHGEEKTFGVVLAERTTDILERRTARGGSDFGESERSKPKLETGLTTEDVPQRLARAMNIPGGALIISVNPGSLGEGAGLRGQIQSRQGGRSEVIVAAGSPANIKPVIRAEDLTDIVREIKSGSPIVFKVMVYIESQQSGETLPAYYTSFIKP